MKRNRLLLSMAVMMLLSCSSVLGQTADKSRYQPREENQLQSQQGYSGALEYIGRMRNNLTTGTVSPEEIQAAQRQAQELRQRSGNVLWSEVGPDNKGGRTRAILVDRSNSNVIYAGGVAGGLWKSTTAGSSWVKIDDLAENLTISCIAQDNNGIIYFGTGEGFAPGSGGANGSTGFIGGGLFKSDDASGNTFSLVSSTIPTSITDDWIYTFEIACDPNTGRIYVGTYKGLQMSDDGGATWTNPILYPGSTPYQSPGLDVEVGSDGSVVAVVGSRVFTSPNGAVGSFVCQSTGATGKLPVSQVGRVELDIAPSNNNYIYAVLASATQSLHSVYRSTDKGETWVKIGPGGSSNFNPLGTQGYYDNAVVVDPEDENHIFIGGLDLWEWNDGGTWIQKSLWYLDETSAYYLHADHHEYVYDPTNTDIMYFGTDGGVARSINGGNTFGPLNKNFSTIQFYSIACNLFGMVMGGTQDNGTQLITRYGNTPKSSVQVLGGDGGWAAMSYINPNVIVGSLYYADIYRSNEFGGSMAGFYDADILAIASPDGAWDQNFAAFVPPLLLDEDIYEYDSPDSLYYVADTNYFSGDVVIVKSNTGDFPFPYTLTSDLAQGDSIQVQDIVQARFYVGATNAVYMTKGVHDFSGAPEWFKIATISGQSQSMAISDDGNYLFVGTSGGNVYRISNLVAVKDSLSGDIGSPFCLVEYKLISSIGAGRPITSISVDPQDANKVLVTLGNYGQNFFVYMSSNALDSTVTFTNKTGNLPKAPVYSSVIEMHNSNTVLVGTENGVFMTTNISAASPAWTLEIDGMANVPVYMLRQQTLNYPYNTNYGVIYAGTHGRGAFESMSYVGIEDSPEIDAAEQIGIYPNPATDMVNLSFNLSVDGSGMIYLYDINGKLVSAKASRFNRGSNVIQYETANLVSGNYMFEIRCGEETLSGKLIKM